MDQHRVELSSDALPEAVDELTTPIYAPYERVGRLVTNGTTVLDIGCGNGKVGAYLSQLGAVVDGVEPSPARAEVAARRLNYVSTQPLCAERSDARLREAYDLVLFLDVLEHLVDPSAALDEAAELVAADGAICALIPNSAHFSFRAKILRGDWTYAPGGGLFDRTHLRFFDTNTARNLRPANFVEGFRAHSSFGRVAAPAIVNARPNLMAKHVYLEWRRA